MQPHIFGILIMSLSSLLFSVMSGLIRYAEGIDPFKTSLFRFAIGMALLGTGAILNRINLSFRKSRLLFFRGIAGSLQPQVSPVETRRRARGEQIHAGRNGAGFCP